MNLIIKTLREAAKTPGFTTLYIIGVALTIAFTMIYGILLYGQLAPVYPEYDRSETFYLSGISMQKPEYTYNTGYSRMFVDDYLRPGLKSADLIVSKINYIHKTQKVQSDGHVPEFRVELGKVDPAFFDLYRYEFLTGKPFTQADFDSKLKVAAISDKVATRLFGTPEEALGQYMKLNHVKYRIVGVFREGNALSVDSYAEVFIPYDNDEQLYGEWPQELGGALSLAIKAKPGKKKQIINELSDVCRRINAIDTAAAKVYIPYLQTHLEHVLEDSDYDIEEGNFQVKEGKGALALWRPLFIALLIVLVIPALNISGLIGSRMERITPEIGILRSFGATRRRLMAMVMTENLVLTLIGGIFGLIFAWIILACAGDFLIQFTPMGYIKDPSFSSTTSFITGEMAFAPLIFAGALIVCLVLNTLSAWIPTHRALHRQITESINTKR